MYCTRVYVQMPSLLSSCEIHDTCHESLCGLHQERDLLYEAGTGSPLCSGGSLLPTGALSLSPVL